MTRHHGFAASGALAALGIVVGGVVVVVAALAASPGLLPVWEQVLPRLSPELADPQLSLADGQVRLVAGLGREVLIGHQVVAPDPRHRVTAAVPFGPAVQLPALLLAAGCAAAAISRRVLPGLMALALAAAAALLETPLLLAAAVHDELLRLLSPESTSPLVAAAQWLNHGGRWLFAIVGVAALMWPLLGAPRAVAQPNRPRRA